MKPTHEKQKHVSKLLKQLLLEGKVGTQEEICRELTKQHYAVSQANVSRLLKQIGAVKILDSSGRHHYRMPHEHGLMHEMTATTGNPRLNQYILDVVHNEHMIVIHTTPGAAGMIAREIDLHRVAWGILGTIAGDDTILVIVKNMNIMTKVTKHIEAHFSV